MNRKPDHSPQRRVANLIAQFCGVAPDRSRSRPRDTRDVGGLMDHLLRKHRIGMKTPEEAIRDAWTEIVGEANAQYCHPLRLEREKTLVVGTSNPVIRQELQFNKRMVLERIRGIPGCEGVSDVIFRAA
jgi:hypothetical protein